MGLKMASSTLFVSEEMKETKCQTDMTVILDNAESQLQTADSDSASTDDGVDRYVPKSNEIVNTDCKQTSNEDKSCKRKLKIALDNDKITVYQKK